MVDLLLVILFFGFAFSALSTAYLSAELKSTKELYIMEVKFVHDLMAGTYGVWGKKDKVKGNEKN